MRQVAIKKFLLLSTGLALLAACQPGHGIFAPVQPDGQTASITGDAVATETLDGALPEGAAEDGAADPAADAAAQPAAPARQTKLVDRDVEAPTVFQVTDDALWDGRPSLGGVWVASPDATDPERVILRNPANGKFVIGALFRRERDNPGPALQISSDAAEALGLLAGQPGKINVTALRREEVPVSGGGAPILDAAETVEPGAAAIAADAAAAIDKAAGKSAPDPVLPTAPAAKGAAATTAPAAPAPAAQTGGSLIQIGIFSVESNAKRAVDALAKVGVAAAVRSETTKGKAFWSVTARGDKSTLAAIKKAGFSDAYVLK